MSDLISREAAVQLLREKASGYKVSMFLTSSECNTARVVATECAVDLKNLPAVESVHNFDLDANILIDQAMSRQDLRFRETDEMCPRCQRDLEVYYCENRTYAVRCSHCKMVTLVQASNPYEAAEKVGLHVKPVRHGQWIIKSELEENILESREYDEHFYAVCSECSRTIFLNDYICITGDYKKAVKEYPYCHCGAKMEGVKE